MQREAHSSPVLTVHGYHKSLYTCTNIGERETVFRGVSSSLCNKGIPI